MILSIFNRILSTGNFIQSIRDEFLLKKNSNEYSHNLHTYNFLLKNNFGYHIAEHTVEGELSYHLNLFYVDTIVRITFYHKTGYETYYPDYNISKIELKTPSDYNIHNISTHIKNLNNKEITLLPYYIEYIDDIFNIFKKHPHNGDYEKLDEGKDRIKALIQNDFSLHQTPVFKNQASH